MPVSKWALKQLQQRFLKTNQSNNNTRGNNNTNQDNNNTNNTKNRIITLVVPYIKGISEKFKRLCKSKGTQVPFKGINTLRTQLVNPKDKDPKLQKSGIIYHCKCPHLNCPEAYIAETGRALGDRVSEQLKVPSPIYTHRNNTGHPLDPNCFNIIHKENTWLFQDHKRSNVHRSQWHNIEQKPRKAPTTTCMG